MLCYFCLINQSKRHDDEIETVHKEFNPCRDLTQFVFTAGLQVV